MKKILIFTGAFLTLTIFSCDRASSTQSWMFTLSGNIISTGEGLFLLQPESHVIAFSDRPERSVHTLSLQDFVQNYWGPDASFSEDPPNASLVSSKIKREQTAILVLNKLSYAEDGSLLVQYELLEGQAPSAGTAGVLVIDAVPTPVNGQITD